MVQGTTTTNTGPPASIIVSNPGTQNVQTVTFSQGQTMTQQVVTQQMISQQTTTQTDIQQTTHQVINASQQTATTNKGTKIVTAVASTTPNSSLASATRPSTPHQIISQGNQCKSNIKTVKTVSSSTSTENFENKATASNQENVAAPKTITIKIDPNAFLCEWRGCLKYVKLIKLN